jgi:hypothetical protein
MRRNRGGLRARSDGLAVEPVGDELLVYDLDRDEAHSLDRMAAGVWRACDGRREETELAAVVAAELGEPVTDEVIVSALAQLEERHLLDGAPTRATAGADLSRRQILVRIGATGAAAGLALPVINSIVAPAPASAGSLVCFAFGQTCGTWDYGAQQCTGGGSPLGCCPGFTCVPGANPQDGDDCTCVMDMAP